MANETNMEKNLVEEKESWYDIFKRTMLEFGIDSVQNIIQMIDDAEDNETQEKVDEIKNSINSIELTREQEEDVFNRFSKDVKTFKSSSQATSFIQKKLERKTRLLENRIDRIISQDFGSYLKELRLGKDFSLKDVERITGISPSYTNRIEKGERKAPSYPIIEKLATAYGVPVQDLLVSAGLKVEEDTNIQSLSKIIYTNNFTINGTVIPAQKKEILNELLEKLENAEWTNDTKHLDTISLIDVINRYKAI